MKKVKNSILVLLSLLAFSACEDGQNEREIIRKYYPNTDLQESEDSYPGFNWVEGNKLVFRFSLQHPDEVNVSDDELTEVFFIEVPSNVTSFSYNSTSDNINADVEVQYLRLCYCYFPAGFEFTKLIVEGEKISNGQWSVSFEMEAEGDNYTYDLKDAGIYTQGVYGE